MKHKDTIELTDYDHSWKNEASNEIEHIKNVLNNNLIVDIQHIGSTAIPNIKSKPIIDIMIGVKTFDELENNFIKPLESIGYIFCKDNPDKDRLFFAKGMPPFDTKRTHHIHIVKYDTTPGKSWRKHIFFRDHLIKHPEIAKKYETLKIRLTKQYKNNREKYSQEKKVFIENIIKEEISRQLLK